MIGKINLLVIALFSTILVLIVNAAEQDTIGNSSNVNNNATINNSIEKTNNQFNETKLDSTIENTEKGAKAVTASFGVYLTIVG